MLRQIFKVNTITIAMMVCFNAQAVVMFSEDTNPLPGVSNTLTRTGDIVIGNTGTGKMVVNGGSQATVTGGQLILGNQNGSDGEFCTYAAGSSLTLDRNIVVGNDTGSKGVMNIGDGAQVHSGKTGNSELGKEMGSSGEVNIRGENSLWDNKGITIIGAAGKGTLNIKEDASVNALTLRIGDAENGEGAVNIDGATVETTGSTATSGFINIGTVGKGELTIINGGQVNASNYTSIAEGSGSGLLSVSGTGSVFNSNSYTTLGGVSGSVAEISIADGGALNTGLTGLSDDDESLILGAASGSKATVSVSGANSFINTNDGITSIGKAGNGTLTVADGGSLNTAGISLAPVGDGVLNIGDGAAAGNINPDAAITFGFGDGTLNFNHNDADYTFDNLIQSDSNSTGKVEVNSGGSTMLTAQNTWTGSTAINNGTLKAGAANTFSPNSTYDIAAAGTLDTNGFDQTIGNTTNAGTINLDNGAGSTTLTIDGDYVGNGGLINFGTVLGDDSSATDKMLVTGNTSGTSLVAVNNLGGAGAQTVEGIELINVKGTSGGEFSQQGRIVAGAFEYHLARGEGAADTNWYLTSVKEEEPKPVEPPPVIKPPVVIPPEITNPEIPPPVVVPPVVVPPVVTPPVVIPPVRELRPEAGAYTANLYAMDNLFSAPLSDRMGETEVTDTMTGERHLTSLWMKNTGGHTRFSDTSGQLKTRDNRFTIVLGGDLATGDSTDGGTWRTGVMAGYGYSHNNTVSNLSGYRAKGQVNGYTVGAYATWFGDGSSERGVYVDGSLQYSWFHNSVQGDLLPAENYTANGLGAAVETGYVFAMGNVTNRQDLTWYVQPRIAASWSGIKAGDYQEVNGTRVQGNGDNNVATRVGLKTFLKGHSVLDDGKDRNFKPFVEASWIHNIQTRGVTMDGFDVNQAGTRNIGEGRMGVEGRITPQWNVTGYVAQEFGGEGYSDTAGVVGAKYSF